MNPFINVIMSSLNVLKPPEILGSTPSRDPNWGEISFSLVRDKPTSKPSFPFLFFLFLIVLAVFLRHGRLSLPLSVLFPDNPLTCTFPWPPVSMATKEEEDEAGAWQNTVRQTARGGRDPHEVEEDPRGRGEENGGRGGVMGRVQQKQNRTVLWFQLILGSLVCKLWSLRNMS